VGVDGTETGWQQSLDALRDEVRRVTELLRSVRDPGAPAVGQWSLAEVAMHLSQGWVAMPGLARRDLSRVYAVLPDLADVAGGSLIRDMWELGGVTTRAVQADPERDPAVLADRIEQRAEEYFAESAGHRGDEPRAWLVEGATVPLSALTGHLLSETLMHGYDIARADGQPWRIEPARAAMVLRQFFLPVIRALDARTFVNGPRAAQVRAAYDIRLRGRGRVQYVFRDGTLRAWEPAPGDKPTPVDCHISADPTAFFKVFWRRQSQWNAVARGQLVAWGRKPWLGPQFRSLIRNP
jgi:hypothetical protein